jgi:hypothetical protein
VNGQDGKFSSAAFSVSLTVFSIVIIIVNYSQFPQRLIVEGAVLILGSLSSIGILVMVLQQRRHRLRRRIKRDLTLKIKLIFLWIFGLACIVSSSYDIAVNFDCLSRHQPISVKELNVYGVMILLLHIIFYFTQVGFLSAFAGHALYISIAQNYMMSFVILTHLVLWFLNFYINLHSTKENPNMCFFNSNLAQFRANLRPFVKPAKTEFSLLAVELIMVLWIYSVDGEEENQEEFGYVEECDEFTSLVQVSGEQSSPRKPSQSSLVSTKTFYICILFGTLLGLPLTVSTVVLSYSSTFSLRNYNAFLITLLLFYAEHMILILVTFTQMSRYSQWRNLKSSTIMKNKSLILILTMAGSLCYSAFEIMVSPRVVNSCNSTKHGVLTFDTRVIHTSLVKTLFEILTMFLQTLLIRQSWQMEKCAVPAKMQTIKRLLGTLCVMNLILWLVFSLLFDSNLRTMTIEVCFYGNTWKTISDGLFSMTVFYRFYTAMHFYEICRKYS